VVRAGWGVYFASQRLLDQQFSIVAPGVSLVQAVANSISEPFPTFVLGQNVFPPLTTQTITREFADNISGAIFAQDTGLRTPYVEQWNFSVQHTLGERNLIEVAYVGNQAHKLNSRWDANDCSVADSLACVPSAVRWSQYPFVLFSTNDGNSNYHALVAKFHRQFSRGFSF